MESVDRTPASGDDAYAFRADLKAYFGKLDPGTYRVRFHWSADGYVIEGRAGYAPKDLESEWHDFEVNAIDSDEAGGAPAYLMIARKGPPDPTVAGPLPRRHVHEHACGVPVYRNSLLAGRARATPGQPLRVPLMLWRLEKGGAAPAQFYWQPWKARTIPNEAFREVKPGETIEVSLPDREFEGDGVYCYSLELYHRVPGHPEPFRLGNASSKPFVIDRVTAAHTDNKKSAPFGRLIPTRNISSATRRTLIFQLGQGIRQPTPRARTKVARAVATAASQSITFRSATSRPASNSPTETSVLSRANSFPMK